MAMNGALLGFLVPCITAHIFFDASTNKQDPGIIIGVKHPIDLLLVIGPALGVFAYRQ